MSPDVRVLLSDQVLTQKVGEEVVILDLSGEAYFGLDAVGARMWELLENGVSLDEVVRTLTEEYDVTAHVVRADLERLVVELEKHGLASVVSP